MARVLLVEDHPRLASLVQRALEAAGIGPVSRLQVSLRIVLEALLRHCDGRRVTPRHVHQLANWQPRAER
ncbi:hypothetical protein, partial [Aquabacterium sp.]|uniref:hypothetical protein n=1 Tax=Aquabacterium sp. TaxID=1872578 RepID=UPI0035C6700C